MHGPELKSRILETRYRIDSASPEDRENLYAELDQLMGWLQLITKETLGNLVKALDSLYPDYIRENECSKFRR